MSNQLNVTVLMKQVGDAVENVRRATDAATRATDAATRATDAIEALRAPELNSGVIRKQMVAAAVKANAAAGEASNAANNIMRVATEATRAKHAIVSKITTFEEQLRQKERLATKTREAKEAAINQLRAAERFVINEKNKFNRLNRKNNTSSQALLAARRNVPMYIKKVEAITDAADKVDQNIQQLFNRIVVLYELDESIFNRVAEAKIASRAAEEAARDAGASATNAMTRLRAVLNVNAERAERAASAASAAREVLEPGAAEAEPGAAEAEPGVEGGRYKRSHTRSNKQSKRSKRSNRTYRQ